MSIGRLRRNLDVDLINRMKDGWTPSGRTLSSKSGGVMVPRDASTYRANGGRRDRATTNAASYVPALNRGRTYKPNGKREVARRLRQSRSLELKQAA